MNYLVKRYTSELKEDWIRVLADSRNGIFIFDRDFIEYHGDRFSDFSAIAYLDGEPMALLPATIDLTSCHVTSHAGLTFGGVVLKRTLRGDVSIILINAILDALKAWGALGLTVKLLPQIFCTYPSAEIEYTLWRRGFALIRRDLSSVLPLFNPLPFNVAKRQSVRKSAKSGLAIKDVPVECFHTLLESVLREQHGVAPVHSLYELELLTNRFPDRIFIRAAVKDENLLAGALIFNYSHIWHTQYLASSDVGRTIGALDFVIKAVIEEARSLGLGYISFGASTESAGAVLNNGLLWQKESYGARSIVHDFMSGML